MGKRAWWRNGSLTEMAIITFVGGKISCDFNSIENMVQDINDYDCAIEQMYAEGRGWA